MNGQKFINSLLNSNILVFCRAMSESYSGKPQYLEKTDPTIVVNLFKEFGLVAKYHRADNYYSIKYRKCEVEFNYNYILKYGIFIPVISVNSENHEIAGSGTISNLFSDLSNNDERLAQPGFVDYSELKELIQKYLDFLEQFEGFLLKD
jgi:hypothetical protein